MTFFIYLKFQTFFNLIRHFLFSFKILTLAREKGTNELGVGWKQFFIIEPNISKNIDHPNKLSHSP